MHTILTCYKGVVSIYGSMVFAKMGVPVPNRLHANQAIDRSRRG